MISGDPKLDHWLSFAGQLTLDHLITDQSDEALAIRLRLALNQLLQTKDKEIN